ncbi:MAG: metal/formaldehyde-sensitive transcriptional repressor [Gemmatimonadaceae bacterium]
MPHIVRQRTKLLNRVRRIRGQLNSVERLLKEEREYGIVLQTLAASRGAIHGLMSEILEDHVRYHVIDPRTTRAGHAEAAEQLVDLVRSYLK